MKELTMFAYSIIVNIQLKAYNESKTSLFSYPKIECTSCHSVFFHL